MAQPPPNAGSLIGQRLDEFELVALLALGGTAEIYLARHAGLAGFEKYVVVKCLHDHLADDGDFVKMFLDEARLGARLDHSNIVQTTKLGSQQGRYYIVQEYLAGMSLSFIVRKAAERVPGGRLPVDLVLNLIAQAAYGLHYAHERRDSDGNPLNMVHRDVSPQNLVISFEGVLKVVDFGIAKASVRDTRTQSGTIKGKFAYMSPEQCMAGEIDRRTDVFALGAITHELLAGQRLFKRESAYDTYHAILECNVEPPSAVIADIEPELDSVVMRALAKNAGDRYPTAEAFGDALVTILHRHGKSVSHGAVAQFFEEFFGAEIDEHGQRMRALISGRKTTVDEHWDDDDARSAKPPDSATEEPDSGSAPPPGKDTAKQPPFVSGAMHTTELSLGDAALLDLVDPGGDDASADDGATRIEMNPLEQAQQRHGELTGQLAAVAARATPAGPANDRQKNAPGSSTRAPAGYAQPGSAPVPVLSRSPDPSLAPAPDSQDSGAPAPKSGKFAPEALMATQIAGAASASPGAASPSSSIGGVAAAPPIDDAAADAETVMADDDQAAAVAAAVARMNAPAVARMNAPARGADPGGKFPSAADVRTQIASPDPPATPARDSGPMTGSPPLGQGFPSAADLRTQIAQPEEPGSGQVRPVPHASAGFPASADLRTQIAPAGGEASPSHAPPFSPPGNPHGSPGNPHGPPGNPSGPPGSGPTPVQPGPGMGAPVPGGPFAGMPQYLGLDDAARLPFPMQAQSIHTSTHGQLMGRHGPAGSRKPTPVWLLAVIFTVAIGAGLGLTVLLASLF